MRALILAAGLGTRLRPLTQLRAKAAVPVNGTPLVSRVVSWLVSHGITDLVVNLHHQPASIARVVGDGREAGARVRYSWEQPVLGSAGGPRHALPLLVDGIDDRAREGSFLVVNGDTLTDVDPPSVLRAHERSGALVTMALIRNPDPARYGGVAVEDGWITGFTRPGTGGPSYHFIGVQAARAAAFASLEDGVPAESVMGLYPRLLRERPGALAAYVADSSFSDIGTPADYLHTSLAFAEAEGSRLVDRRDSSIAPTARLERTIVWDGVSIGAGAQLTECIAATGAVIPAGREYRRVVLVPYSGQPPGAGERLDDGLLVRSL